MIWNKSHQSVNRNSFRYIWVKVSLQELNVSHAELERSRMKLLEIHKTYQRNMPIKKVLLGVYKNEVIFLKKILHVVLIKKYKTPQLVKLGMCAYINKCKLPNFYTNKNVFWMSL